MAEDLLSKYVDRISFADDTKFATEQLALLEKQFLNLKNNLGILQGATGVKNISVSSVEAAKSIALVNDTIEKSNKVLLLQEKINTEKSKQESIAAKNRIAEIQQEIKEQERLVKAASDAAKAAEKVASAAAKGAKGAKTAAPKLSTEQKLQSTISASQLGSYDQLNAKLKLAVIEFNKLSEAERSSSKGANLQNEIIALDTELKKLDASVGKFQRNVGNYKDGFKGFAEIGKDAANKVGQSFNNMAKNIAASVVAFVGIQSIFSFFKQGLEVFEKSEVASARLENSLKNVGGTSKDLKVLTDQSAKLRAQFQYLSSTDLKEVQQKLVVFGKLSTEQIGQATQTIIDFAANQRITIPEATDVYTKALEGSGRALKQYGINIKDAKSESERFAVLQTELANKVKGSAATFGESAEGKIEAYSKKLNGLKKAIGEQLFPVYDSFLDKSDSLIETFKKAIPALTFLASNILYIVGAYVAWRTALLVFNTVKAVSIAQSYAAAIASGEEAVATALASKTTLLGTIIYNLAALAKRAWAAATAFLTTEINILNTSLRASPLGIILSVVGLLVIAFASLSASAGTTSQAFERLAESKKKLNDAEIEGAKNAAVEIANLEKTYAAATNKALGIDKQTEAAKKLQETYPVTFGNFTLEEIMLGKAKQGYEDLSKSILAVALVKAKQALIDKNAQQYAEDDENLIQQIKKKQERLKNAIADDGKTKFGGDGPGGEIKINKTDLQNGINQLQEERRRKKKIYEDGNKDYSDSLAIDSKNSALANANEAKRISEENAGLKNKLGGEKEKKEKGEKSIANLIAELNTEFEIYKLHQARLIELFKEDANNQKLPLDKRLDALKNFSVESTKLINEQEIFDREAKKREAEREIENLNKDKNGKSSAQVKRINENIKIIEKNTKKELLLIEEKGNDEIIKATKIFGIERVAIIKNNADNVKKELKDELDLKKQNLEDETTVIRNSLETQYNDTVTNLNDLFLAGKISKEKLNSEKLKADLAFQEVSLRNEIDYQKNLIRISRLSPEEKAKALNELDTIEKGLSSRRATALKDLSILQQKLSSLFVSKKGDQFADQRGKLDEYLEGLKQIGDVADKSFAVVNGLINASNTRLKNKLEDEKQNIDKKAEAEIAAITASSDAEEKKAAKIAIINARTAAQKEAIARKEKQLEIDKARFDKAQAIFNIILATAVAVISAKTIVGRIVAAAAGAASLAVAFATPIPRFKTGKNNDYEGPAIVGDGGVAEYIERSDGTLERTPAKDTLTYLGKSDIVHPDLMSLMMSRAMPALPTLQVRRNEDLKSDMIHAELKKLNTSMNIVANKRENHLSAKEGALVSLWKHGANQTAYFDENTNW